MKKLVTISREYGSGGHEIAEMLAKDLGYALYDRNLLDHMWDGLDINSEDFEKYDEKSKTPFLTRRVRGHSSSIEDNLAHLQFEFIKEKANSGESFVIVGRCAEAVLRNHPGLISVFIMADEPFKLKRIEEKFDLSPRKAENKMVRHDYNRKKYHNTYSQFKWGDSRGYDICMNSARLDIEGTVESLYRYVQDRRANL